VFHAQDPFSVRELIPDSLILPTTSSDLNVAVRHTDDAVRILRNLGFNAPAPILSSYTWPGKYPPMTHQRLMAEFWTMTRRGFNLSQPGTGKTAAALWAADYLMTTGQIKKALICAPLSTLDRVWKQDIFDVLMHRKAGILHGSAAYRKEMLDLDLDFYIINHDGLKVAGIAKAIREHEDIGLVIMDEGDFFWDGSTEKYKALRIALRPDMRLWWQTATPAANKPTQAWAQARLVNPSRVPQYFGTFQRHTMFQVAQHRWEPKPDAAQTVFNALQPAIRFRKADCLDLPPVVTLERQVAITKQQRDALSDMLQEMRTDLASGQQITAVNAADKLGKIRQILCGCVRSPDTEEYVILDHHTRVAELRRAIDAASAKVLVIVPYKGITQALEQELSKHYSVGVLNGDVTAKHRNETIKAFKSGPDPHILLCHPRVMAHGLNLVEADTTVFYAPIDSNTEYRQVIERNNRPGQTRNMTIYRLGSHPLEWEIYRRVDQRELTQTNILEMYNAVVQNKQLTLTENDIYSAGNPPAGLPPMDYDQLVRAFINLRDAEAAVTREADAKKKALREQRDKIEAAMLGILNSGNGEGIRTAHGTFFRQEEIMPACRDWDAFYDWIAENDAFDALERRVKRGFIVDHMARTKGELPPGISVFRQFKVGVRKNSGGECSLEGDD